MTEFQISPDQINPGVVGTPWAKQQPRLDQCLCYRLAQVEQLPPGTECGNFGCDTKVGSTGKEIILSPGASATLYCLRDGQSVPKGITVVTQPKQKI